MMPHAKPTARRGYGTSTGVLCLVAGLALSGGPCVAQEDDAPPPDTQEGDAPDRRPDARLDPLLTDISADEHMRDLLSRPLNNASLTPSTLPVVQQVVPNLGVGTERIAFADGTAASVDPLTLRPEGTFLVGWTGEIVRMRTGGLAFLPVARTGAARPEPAMALLPCSSYSGIETLLGSNTRGLWLSLTGEVLDYQDRNWLLPTAFASAEMPPPGEPAPTEVSDLPEDDAALLEGQAVQPEGEAAQPEGTPTDPESSGDRVEDLIRQLEAQRQERRGIDTTFAQPADEAHAERPDGNGATPGPRLEGRMLLNQRGRMVRSSSGDWVIAIDNDGGASNMGNLPHHIRLLPCKLVESMEYKGEAAGENWAFEISGHLYVHGEMVYLLPRMLVARSGNDEVRALQ